MSYIFIFTALTISLFLFQHLQAQLHALQNQSLSTLLGGDVLVDIGYREFDERELSFIEQSSVRRSEIVNFRSMVQVEKAELPLGRLSSIRAVDQSYPMFGEVEFQPTQKDFQRTLVLSNNKYGVYFSQELAEYFEIKPGESVKIADFDFEYLGVVKQTPDLHGNNNVFLPSAIISLDAVNAMKTNAASMLFDHQMYIELKDDVLASAFKSQAQTGLSEQAWDVTTSDEFAAQQNTLLTLALRLGGMINLLVVIAFSAALFSIFRTHFSEEIGTQQQLSAMGASTAQIACVYVLRFFALLVISLTLSGVFIAVVNMGSPQVFNISIGQITVEHASLLPSFLIAAALLTILSIYVASLAFWSMRPQKRRMILGLACGSLSLLIWYFVREYALNSTMIIILFVFATSVIFVWLFIRLIKLLSRKSLQSKSLRSLALLQYSGKHSTQEFFGAALFANLLICTCFFLAFIAVNSFVDDLRNSDKPTHILADVQSNQVDDIELMLKNAKAQGILRYPIIRGRIIALNDNQMNESDHWLYRGDRVFGIDTSLAFDLKTEADGTLEVALDESTAQQVGAKIGDVFTLSILGETSRLRIKTLRKSNFEFGSFDFIFLLPEQALATYPHIFVETASIAKEHKSVLRGVIDQFPNVIVISSSNALERVQDWADRLVSIIGMLTIYILLASMTALVTIAIILMRKERYENAVLSSMGMSNRNIATLQWMKIIINTVLSTIFVCALSWIFVRFGLSALFELNLTLKTWEFLAAIGSIALFLSAIPSILLYFARSKPENANEYMQDYKDNALDF